VHVAGRDHAACVGEVDLDVFGAHVFFLASGLYPDGIDNATAERR
jgi:hypothetical protein